VFSVVLNQLRRRWIIFKTFKREALSSLSSKASEPLINSTYSFFLAIFTIYAMHELMNSRLFTPSRICTLDVGLHMGNIALLSPTVLILLLSRNLDLR
jgi:hypothetical protein